MPPTEEEVATEIAKDAASELTRKLYEDTFGPWAAIVGDFGGCARAWLQAKVMHRWLPEERRVTPPQSLQGAIMQGLQAASESEELRALYLELLVKAADSETQALTHPAFARLIGELTPDEARMLRGFVYPALGKLPGSPMIRLTAYHRVEVPNVLNTPPDEFRESLARLRDPQPILAELELALVNAHPELEHRDRVDLYLANLDRLGIIHRTLDRAASITRPYELLREGALVRHWQEAVQKHIDDPEVVEERGLLELTAFGKAFVRAVVIEPGHETNPEQDKYTGLALHVRLPKPRREPEPES